MFYLEYSVFGGMAGGRANWRQGIGKRRVLCTFCRTSRDWLKFLTAVCFRTKYAQKRGRDGREERQEEGRRSSVQDPGRLMVGGVEWLLVIAVETEETKPNGFTCGRFAGRERRKDGKTDWVTERETDRERRRDEDRGDGGAGGQVRDRMG